MCPVTAVQVNVSRSLLFRHQQGEEDAEASNEERITEIDFGHEIRHQQDRQIA